MVDGQDSLISGAEMLAFESGACSVTKGHRAHNVCGAERTFEPVADTDNKKKVQQYKPFARHWDGNI